MSVASLPLHGRLLRFCKHACASSSLPGEDRAVVRSMRCGRLGTPATSKC